HWPLMRRCSPLNVADDGDMTFETLHGVRLKNASVLLANTISPGTGGERLQERSVSDTKKCMPYPLSLHLANRTRASAVYPKILSTARLPVLRPASHTVV